MEDLGLRTLTIPAINDIISGQARIDDLKPVAIEDLLGRDPVPAIPSLLTDCIENKNVLITGAGGSIGSELCRQIAKQNPKSIVLFELSEHQLYQINENLKQILTANSNTTVHTILGSAQDPKALKNAMTKHSIHTVYHAAAFKHVPIVEDNPIAAVQNNTLGTLRCAQAAIEANVKSFVLISTDKAVRPTNIMGATKRLAELTLQALTTLGHSTHFSMVRFGNVLGSSGSVVPLFRKQIQQGGPVTVTHPEITRYFMTIPEAAELVIQAGAMGKGGDIFVLDMGEPVKVADLARQMIKLSGLETNNPQTQGDIEIVYTGLRPGEKLYEELLIDNNATGTAHPRIMRAEEAHLSWEETKTLLNKLEQACSDNDSSALKRILLQAPISYMPQDNTPINTSPPVLKAV